MLSAPYTLAAELTFVGDVMVDEEPGKLIEQGADPFASIARYLPANRLRIANLECVVATTGTAEIKPFTFRAHPRTLPEIVAASAQAYPEATALDDGRQALTYTELLEEVRAKGRQLQGAGFGAGDKIGIRIPSGTCELYICILATLEIGAAYVPVDADDPAPRVAPDPQDLGEVEAFEDDLIARRHHR